MTAPVPAVPDGTDQRVAEVRAWVQDARSIPDGELITAGHPSLVGSVMTLLEAYEALRDRASWRLTRTYDSMAAEIAELTADRDHWVKAAVRHAEERDDASPAVPDEAEVDTSAGPRAEHWRYVLTGTDNPSGTIARTVCEVGVVGAECAGEAIEMVVRRGPWDALDQHQPVVLRVTPVGVAAAEAGWVLAPGQHGIGRGIGLIAKERWRQVIVEEYYSNHDARHVNGELVQAAIYYADETAPVMEWPWGEPPKPKGDDRIRDLAKAGALIAAEIDRLSSRPAPESTPDGAEQ